MANESNLYVDEPTLMEKTDILALIEFMETQTISVAKAGITATLRAECGVTIAINPKGGRFDMAGPPLADQIDPKIPPQVLSRCDIIYILPDVPTETKDRKEAEDIMALWQGKLVERNPELTTEYLQKYIASSKRRKIPIMTDAAIRTIVERFVEIRKRSTGGTVTITKRTLETLARMATAHAIMRRADEVTVKDAEIVITVLEYSLKQITFDASTGQLNADRVTGQTKEKRRLGDEIIEIIRAQGGITITAVIIREVKAKNPNLEDNRIRNMIEQMHREGVLLEAAHDKWRVA